MDINWMQDAENAHEAWHDYDGMSNEERAKSAAQMAIAQQLKRIADALEAHNEQYAQMLGMSGYVEDRPRVDREGYVS